MKTFQEYISDREVDDNTKDIIEKLIENHPDKLRKMFLYIVSSGYLDEEPRMKELISSLLNKLPQKQDQELPIKSKNKENDKSFDNIIQPPIADRM